MIKRLKIDIDVGQSEHTMPALYKLLVEKIESFGYIVLDDGNTPCIEDLTDQYTELGYRI